MNNDAVTVCLQTLELVTRSTLVRYSVSRPRRCRQCGTDVSRIMKRCPICGQPLSAHPHTA